MIDDQFRSQLAQFVMHMANMRTWARQNRPLDGRDLATNPEWIAAADQRRILETYLELLCTQSIIGIGNGPDAGEQRLGTDGPPISWQRLRALGSDAANMAQIAMTGKPWDGWQFDPRLPDGLTEYYPGKSKKPGQI